MNQKILIVDDSSTARALFSVCFREHPEYQVIQANHWKDAIEKAELHRPFMVVLDYNMPEKTGGEVAQLMQNKGIKSHYVLITANTQQTIVDEVNKLGFFAIIEKPISAEKIQSLLEKL
jgi:CheY-like chemotaxis protein